VRRPAGPPLAARAEGTTVDPRALRAAVEWWCGQVELLLVEGVGGLLAPVSDQELVIDLACDLGFPLLIVARRGLGTINHTLLTCAAARSRGLTVAGIILNEPLPPDPGDVSAELNAAELARWSGLPILGEVRHAAGQGLPGLRELQTIPWRSLAQPGGVVPARH
ncbi:MAG: dethiobiotin synthase, partial [Planctomycetaceae bacterium]